jgi:hypothetical protein
MFTIGHGKKWPEKHLVDGDSARHRDSCPPPFPPASSCILAISPASRPRSSSAEAASLLAICRAAAPRRRTARVPANVCAASAWTRSSRLLDIAPASTSSPPIQVLNTYSGLQHWRRVEKRKVPEHRTAGSKYFSAAGACLSHSIVHSFLLHLNHWPANVAIRISIAREAVTHRMRRETQYFELFLML